MLCSYPLNLLPGFICNSKSRNLLESLEDLMPAPAWLRKAAKSIALPFALAHLTVLASLLELGSERGALHTQVSFISSPIFSPFFYSFFFF